MFMEYFKLVFYEMCLIFYLSDFFVGSQILALANVIPTTLPMNKAKCKIFSQIILS